MSSVSDSTARLTDRETNIDEPRLIWGPEGSERIRLLVLARKGRRLYPQPEEELVPTDGPPTRRLLITSESAGGLGYWLQSAAITRLGLRETAFDGREHVGNDAGHTLHAFEETLGQGGAETGDGLRLYHHLEVLARGVREDCLARLRARLEGNPEFGCLLGGEDPRLFDTGPYSSIEPHLDVYRTPWFHEAEVAVLSREWAKGRPPMAGADHAAIAASCVDATGGQPLLVQHHLRAIFEGCQPVDSAWEYVHDHPPAVLRHWQRRLAEVVHRSPTARREADWFVGGGETPLKEGRFETWPLYLTGWLGLVGTGAGRRYRFSTLHQEWARPVLRSHDAFLEAP